jgi:hypothetical protein
VNRFIQGVIRMIKKMEKENIVMLMDKLIKEISRMVKRGKRKILLD